MYLYFDSRGVLKEIINDNALRQGDAGNDYIYIYVEGITSATIENYHPWIRFVKEGHNPSAEMMVDDAYVIPDDEHHDYIPFNEKRDLRYFKYYTDYPFFRIPFTQDLTIDEVGIDPDAYDYDMLDTAGTVSLTVRLYNSTKTTVKALGLIVFNVEKTTEDLDGTVEVEEYLSLAQWNYLLARMEQFAPENATTLYRHKLTISVDFYDSHNYFDIELEIISDSNRVVEDREDFSNLLNHHVVSIRGDSEVDRTYYSRILDIYEDDQDDIHVVYYNTLSETMNDEPIISYFEFADEVEEI